VKEAAGKLPESRVVKIWQDYLPGRTDLCTEEDGPIGVVYPGRRNDDRGADLCDAVIDTEQGLRKGDVEVHIRSSHWWGHRHHQDPSYNRVILHVVYWRDTAAPVTLQNGRRVPTLALEKYVAVGRSVSRRTLPCRGTIVRRQTAFVGAALEEAGDHRFKGKVAEFREAASRVGAFQALYQGIMGALGYVKNKVAMIELARRLPLSRLTAVVTSVTPHQECLARYQALLLGTAGLLPSQVGGNQTGGPWPERLENIWAAQGQAVTMSAADWHSFKVRPGSLPRRRLAAMSYLLRRVREEGLLPVLLRELESSSPEKCFRSLKDWLFVGAEGFWAENLDFGLPARQTAPALLGADRADIIVVNVLLPFVFAWAEEPSRSGLAARAMEIYRSYPALGENALEKHMRRQLGISPCTVNSARRQQGLLHIYKTYCSQGKCRECPLS
jgi:hypothetical protein